MVWQKYSHLLEKSKSKKRKWFRQPHWIAGFLLWFLGSIGNAFAQGLAPQSLLGCLAPVALVVNCILSPCILGEQVCQWHFAGVFCIIAGVVFTVTHIPSQKTDTVTPAKLAFYCTRPATLYISFYLKVWHSARHCFVNCPYLRENFERRELNTVCTNFTETICRHLDKGRSANFHHVTERSRFTSLAKPRTAQFAEDPSAFLPTTKLASDKLAPTHFGSGYTNQQQDDARGK